MKPHTTVVLLLGVLIARPPVTWAHPMSVDRQSQPKAQRAPETAAIAKVANAEELPPDYVIGPEDVLSIVFWKDKDMSADVVVRPDGRISLPLLNDIEAAGLTPAQLRERVLSEAQRFIEDPSPTVVVKQINSRKVFITGQVARPGPYPLTGRLTVVQLIALAGGLVEFANGKKIVIMRTEGGRQMSYPFNYNEVIGRRNLRQNIELKPGDTVLIP